MSVARRALAHNRALEAMLVGSQAAGVLAGIVVARSVGPTGRGTVVTLAVWGQILGWLAAFSLDKAVVVLTSEADPVASPDEALRSVRLPMVITSCLAVIASVLVGRRLFSSNVLTIALAASAVATVQSELIAGWLLATGRRQTFILWRLLQPSLYLAFILLVAGFLHNANNRDRTVVMGMAVAASLVGPVVFALGRLWRRPPVVGRGFHELLRFALAAHVANVFQYLNGRLDILLLTFLVPPAILGYYSAGSALGQAALLMASAGVIRGITGEAKATDLTGIAIASFMAAIVIITAPFAVPMVFGGAFKAAVPIARILALGGVVNYALQGACGRLLGARRPWFVVFSQAVGVSVFAIGIARFHSVQGVAWSSVVSFVAALIVAEIALRLATRRGAFLREVAS